VGRHLPRLGTTLMAAELTERICYGLEIDPRYVDVIVPALATTHSKIGSTGR
jgi:DNA modification methylase